MDLHSLGWARYSPASEPESSYGRVALVRRDRLLVWTADGEVVATLSGALRRHHELTPSVGDWVVLREASVIIDVLPRRTKLSRKEPGKRLREQVLAANMDLLFVVTALDRDYNPRRLERYLVLAYESGARPVIVLNKADLCSDLDGVLQASQSCAPGVPVLAISALEQRGMDVLARQVERGETAALIGSSGAGKSTIVNALCGRVRQRTSMVRESDSKGRHTTTHRELIQMPGGWLLMDLPGLRELQLWADPEGVDEAFAEITALAAQCRFRDCTHQHEPGCAVSAAELDPARLRSYQKLRRELQHLELQTDIHHAREVRKKWNALERDIRRNHPKRKR
ncbi:MAG: ribosome small subunit-dependent GTPase [Acidobacteriaceae bacterium]|nr:ribosome small subunit-dependent GTPase [Acidobacteriaceae bacterium]